MQKQLKRRWDSGRAKLMSWAKRKYRSGVSSAAAELAPALSQSIRQFIGKGLVAPISAAPPRSGSVDVASKVLLVSYARPCARLHSMSNPFSDPQPQALDSVRAPAVPIFQRVLTRSK